MKKQLISNFIYQASYKMLVVILPIITVPIVSRALGPEGVGTFNYVNSIVSYFVLVAGLGIADYGVREIACVKKDKYILSKTFWELESLNIIISIFVFIVYFIFICFFSNRLYFFIAGFTVFAALLDISWIFGGLEDFKLITIRNFIVKISTFILIVFTIKSPKDLTLYFIIQSLSVFLGQLSLWLTLHKKIEFVKVSISGIFKHLKPALTFFIAKIAMTFYQNTSKIILGVMTSMTIVGYFSNALTLVIMSGTIINAMNTIMIPRMSNLYSNNEEDNMIKLLSKAIDIQLFFIIAISFGITAISSSLVDWFFGSDFESLKTIIPFMAPMLIFQSLQMAIASQYLIPRNEMRKYNYSIIIGGIINILICILTIPIIEIYGAILGINLGYLVVCIIQLGIIEKQTEFKMNYGNLFKFIVSGVIMNLIIWILTHNLPSNPIVTIIQVVIGIGVYFLCTYAFKVNPLLILFHDKK